MNTIYVAADSATDISAVQKEITKAVSGATVTTSSDLASEVTGSLSSASSLANNLGKWLAIAVLIAAFLLASLLTMSAVSRRVREFGTLKALGWRSRRVIGQVMGESVTVGVIGGLVGVALGFAGAAIVSAVAPALSASVGQTTGSATPGGARQFSGGSSAAAAGRQRRFHPARWRRLSRTPHGPPRQSVLVHLTASVTVGRGRPRRGAGPGRGPDRRHVRRLAGGPAAPGRRAGQGRVSRLSEQLTARRSTGRRKPCTS